MAVITKVYDLVIWSCQHIAKFPRSHRFTLGDRLEVRLYDVLEKLLRAKYSRDRLPLLRDVNMDLELLRFQFRIAKDLKCLSLAASADHEPHDQAPLVRAAVEVGERP